MASLGHNEGAVRKAALAGDMQIALHKVARCEADAIDGWLAYGAALNEGRALFSGDREFGQWKAENVLSQVGIALKADEEIAAMWAAANADQMAEARAASKARTVRGWHEQWKKIEQERVEARLKVEREADQARKREEAERARAQAQELAKAEAAARAVAAAADTLAERQVAEVKADEAAAAMAEAETVLREAEAQIDDPEPENAEDAATAKLRRELEKLTPEALIDDVISLRADLADAKASAKAFKSERDALRAQIADLTSDDKDAVIRRLQASLKNAESAKWRATEEQGRAMRQVHALKKRVGELEQMGIQITA